MDSDNSFNAEERHARSALPGAALVALLGGCALLVVAAIAAPQLLPPWPTATLAGGGAALGLILWLVALPAGLRHAAPAWKVGGLALLVAAGALAGLMASRTSSATGVRDASSFAEAELTPNGTVVLPRGAPERGPVSRLYADTLAEAARDRDAHGGERGALNLPTLNSPYLLNRDPGVLGRCAEIASLKQRGTHFAARETERAAKLGAAIDASALPEALRGGMRMMAVSEATAQLLAQDHAGLDIAEARCRLLARRSWSDEGGYFAFRSPADLAQFRTLNARAQAVADEQGKLQRAERERMARGQEIVRDILSR